MSLGTGSTLGFLNKADHVDFMVHSDYLDQRETTNNMEFQLEQLHTSLESLQQQCWQQQAYPGLTQWFLLTTPQGCQNQQQRLQYAAFSRALRVPLLGANAVASESEDACS